MRIREARTPPHWGMSGPQPEERVVTLTEGEPLPAGAVAVPDGTPEHDWQPIGVQAAPAEG